MYTQHISNVPTVVNEHSVIVKHLDCIQYVTVHCSV